MLDVVAEGHDELVWEWRESLLDQIEFTDIPVCFIYKPMHLQDCMPMHVNIHYNSTGLPSSCFTCRS